MTENVAGAFTRLEQTEENFQEGRLAGTVGSEEADGAGFEAQRDVAQGVVVAVGVPNAMQVEE